VRAIENRTQHSYPSLAEAVARMQEANPFLSREVAEHLTLHGTNWNADGSIVWKFDNYARVFPPYGANLDEAAEVLRRITCPTLLFWGRESFAKDPTDDPLAGEIANRRVVKVDRAGHWLHHDQLEIFLRETKRFLAE
jgi:pimeloyl-ACP methyl ester carboxylesterase